MRSFFVPRKLLASKTIYIAALHRDQNQAREAFYQWIEGCEPDDITYPEHRLIARICNRFERDVERCSLSGVLQNIGRHCRLRAHVNFGFMNRLLIKPEFTDLNIFALGSTDHALRFGSDTPQDLDLIEWGTDKEGLQRMEGMLSQWGLVKRGRFRNIPFQRASIQSFTGENNCVVRVVGFSDVHELERPANRVGNISIMTSDAHLAFLLSRQSGLLARRDQFVFDFQKLVETRKPAPGTNYRLQPIAYSPSLSVLHEILGV